MKPKIFIDFGKRSDVWKIYINDVYTYPGWHFTQVKCEIAFCVAVFCGSRTHICHIRSCVSFGIAILCENIEYTAIAAAVAAATNVKKFWAL